MGDLNYRLHGVEPDQVLTHISEAGKVEKNLSLFMMGKLSESTTGKDLPPRSPTEIGWMQERYEVFFDLGEGAQFGGLDRFDGSMAAYSTIRRLCSNNSGRGEKEGGEKKGRGGISAGGVVEEDDEDEQEAPEEAVNHTVVDMEPEEKKEKEVDEAKTEEVPPWTRSISHLWKSWSALRPKISRYFFTAADSSYSESSGGVFYKKGEEESFSQDQDEGPWAWVRKYDELSRAMKEREVFSGFSEGPITFPPSFRWRRGANAGDFDQVSGDISVVPSFPTE